MRRRVTLIIAAPLALFLALFMSTSASATSGAHFFKVSSSVNDAGSLLVTYDEAGVGNATVNYTIDVTTAAAVWACINGGGNHPKAANKETVNSSLTVSFSRDPINGRVTGTTSPAIGPLSAGSFTCPSGQTLVLASVSYSGITLTDTTNNVSTTVPDASRTFVNLR
jgi:hypothetical protein